ncbi:DUF5681 domain-containing protein [Sphingomonas sp.]|uniref:DUF5681 domain-containing protein n=1 Tax=Sphingomonas sp. TaxID=28214 RepID=UPI003CC6B9FE
MSNRDYEIGYGKPPMQHRFKPGHSGNARGRPRGARGFKSLVEEALEAKVTLKEGGKNRKVSVAAATLKRLVHKAVVDGDQRAIERVLVLAQQVESDRPRRAELMDDNDHEVVAAFLQRLGGEA